MPENIPDSAAKKSKKGFIDWVLSGGVYMQQKGGIFGTSGVAIIFLFFPRFFALGIDRNDNTALMISFGSLIFAIILIYVGYIVYSQDFDQNMQTNISE